MDAGGGDSLLTLPVALTPANSGVVPMRLSVSGLMGGHSGLNINEYRGNAIIMTAIISEAVLQTIPGSGFAEIRGGDKRNAIPRECFATLVVGFGVG